MPREHRIPTRQHPIQLDFSAVPPTETVPVDHVKAGVEAVNADEHKLKPPVDV